MSSNIIKVHGRKVFVWQSGPEEQEPIIFLHGYAGDHSGLLDIARSLKQKNILIPDLPGFGNSQALNGSHHLQDYVSFLENLFVALHIKKATLVGHSLGGSIALLFAEKNPKRVTKLSLICPVLAVGGWIAQTAKLYYSAAGVFPDHLAKKFVDNKFLVYLTDSLVMTIKDTKKKKRILKDNYGNYKKAQAPALLDSFFSFFNTNVTASVDNIQMPTQLIGGKSDIISPPGPLEKLHKKIPGSVLTLVPGAGHLLPREAPEKVIPFLKAFL